MERSCSPEQTREQLDLAASLLFRDLDVGVTIRNLLDEEYFDPSPLLGVPGDYPRPGRSLLVHAKYRF